MAGRRPADAEGGTSWLEQDADKVYHGDVIDVTARGMSDRIGRRVLGEMTVEEAGGSIQMNEPDEMDLWTPPGWHGRCARGISPGTRSAIQEPLEPVDPAEKNRTSVESVEQCRRKHEGRPKAALR